MAMQSMFASRAFRKSARIVAFLVIITGLASGVLSQWGIERAAASTFAVGETLVVDTPRLNCRTGPGLDYSVDYVMPAGTEVVVLDGPEESDGYHWYKVEMADGSVGWSIGEAFIASSGGGTPSGGDFAIGDEVVVNTDFLNLRTGAGLSKEIITVLPYNTALIVSSGPMAADGYDWYEVETLDGDLGWVAGAYIAYSTGSGGYGDGGWFPDFPVGGTAAVDAPRLNLRTGAGLGFGVVTVMTEGTEVTILDGATKADGYYWYQIETEDGDIGWCIGEGLI